MSTRCTINFNYGKEVVAKVYRHSDGYPDGVLGDLAKFFADVEKDNRATMDTRFKDPSYLAAKYVVWQAHQYAKAYVGGKYKATPRLAFSGVGVVIEDPGDIAYTYFVDCNKRESNGWPTVVVKSVR